MWYGKESILHIMCENCVILAKVVEVGEEFQATPVLWWVWWQVGLYGFTQCATKALHLKPYKASIIQELLSTDPAHCCGSCQWFLNYAWSILLITCACQHSENYVNSVLYMVLRFKLSLVHLVKLAISRRNMNVVSLFSSYSQCGVMTFS